MSEKTDKSMVSKKDLITIKSLEGLTTLDASIISSENFNKQYDLLVVSLEQLTELKKRIDEQIKAVMEEEYNISGESSLISGDRKYSYIPPTTRVTVDTKKLQGDLPEIYAQYARITQVGASLRSAPIKKE